MLKKSTTSLILALLVITITSTSILPSYATNSISQAKSSKQLDDYFTYVTALSPSFGGMFLANGALNIYLKNPSEKAKAVDAITAVFGRERIPAGGVQVLKGDYDFHQLKEWYNRIGSVFNIHGVVYTDIDERANRLTVGVENQAAAEAAQQQLATQRIPSAAVNIIATEGIVPLVTLQDRVRPIQGGLQIQFSNFLCSISFNGIRSGTAGFLTASHCTDIQGGVESTQYYQPLTAGGNFIGTEIADPVYTKAKCQGAGIHGNKVCRYSDSSFEQLASGVTQDLGSIEKTDSVNTGSLNIAGSFRITSEGPSVVGQTVNKVGRTTGWTQGVVTNTCVNTGVSGSKIVQLCQDFVSANVGPGDSGSDVFSITSGNDVQLRGVLWGGNGAGTQFVYSPIANVERSDELGPISTCAAGFSC